MKARIPHPVPRTKTYTSMRVKIFGLENKTSELQKIKATPGHCWNEAAIQKILEHIAADLEHRQPGYEWKLVELGPTAFNFVWVGPKPFPDEGLLEKALYGTPGDEIEQSKRARGRSLIADITERLGKLKYGGKDGTS